MADSCVTCFFYRVPGADENIKSGFGRCQIYAPAWQGNTIEAQQIRWPLVAADDWCGVGCDSVTGQTFGGITVQPGGTPSHGTFSLANASTVTVTDTNCKATSIIKTWNLSIQAGQSSQVVIVAGAGSFGVTSDGSVNVTGTWGYAIYN